MNPTLCCLVGLYIAVNMMTVNSAPLVLTKDMELIENHESSDPTGNSVDQEFNKENEDPSEASASTPGTPASITFTPGQAEQTSDLNDPAAVHLIKRTVRNKRRAMRCNGGLWFCTTNSSILKSHHKKRHSRIHRKHRH